MRPTCRPGVVVHGVGALRCTATVRAGSCSMAACPADNQPRRRPGGAAATPLSLFQTRPILPARCTASARRDAPSISETIDWARTLAVLGATELDAAVLAETVSVVVKYERDHARAVAALPLLLDPNAEVPDRLHDRQDHSPGGHSHSHAGSDSPHTHSDDVGAERRAVKDKPGRHGPGHYGTPPYTYAECLEGMEPELVTINVSSDRGKRSFAGGLGRRRAI